MTKKRSQWTSPCRNAPETVLPYHIVRGYRQEYTDAPHLLAPLRVHDARPRRNGAREKGNEFSSAHAAPPEAKVHRLTQH